MASFLPRLASAQDAQLERELGCVRVALVGCPSVGKTSLAHLLATGNTLASSRPTAGCNVYATLVALPEGDATGTGGGQFFVELWDVSGEPRYSDLRRLFYQQLHGVILVYDLTDRRSQRRLTKWAAEVAAQGTFVAPLSDEVASRNIGGLPVPALVVGNKSDRLSRPHHTRSGSSSAPQSDVEMATSSPRAVAASLRRKRNSESRNNLLTVDVDANLLGVQASARTGRVDTEPLTQFFTALWMRRYGKIAGRASGTEWAPLHGGFAPGSTADAPDRLDDEDDGWRA